VVGVVLNLAVWFSLHTLFGTVHEDRRFWPLQLLVPEWRTVNLPALVIAVGAFIALFRYHADLILTLAVSMLLGFGAWQIWLK
jgi:chromate transporter